MRVEEWRPYLEKEYAESNPHLIDTLLDGMRDGVSIDFVGDRNKNRMCTNLRSATDDPKVAAKVSAAIAADVAALKKAGPFDTPPFPFFSCSPIGAVPKRNTDKIRVIHHLSFPFGGDSINASTEHKGLELGRFDDAADAVRRLGSGCYLIKLDVEAAYKQVPVRRDDWPLLGFHWEGKYYYERVLPFGLKSSCRLWEAYATALHDIFKRHLPIDAVIHYVDDFLFVVKLKEDATESLKQALHMCEKLGIPMAADKVEGPITRLTFLGIQLCTETMKASLDNDRLSELHQLLYDWGDKANASITELQSLAGKLNWACAVIRPGRTFLRRIIDHITTLKQRENGRKGPQPIPKSVRLDIDWWIRHGLPWQGVGLLYETEWTNADRLHLSTDACKRGFGARYGCRWFEGEWNEKQIEESRRKKFISMPYLELYALVLAAHAWGSEWSGRKVEFHCDCLPVVLASEHGASKKRMMAALLRHLATLAFHYEFDFRVRHIPGLTNTAADLLSRGDIDAFHHAFPLCNQQPDPIPQLPMVESM